MFCAQVSIILSNRYLNVIAWQVASEFLDIAMDIKAVVESSKSRRDRVEGVSTIRK